jgi:hypothetical protein
VCVCVCVCGVCAVSGVCGVFVCMCGVFVCGVCVWCVCVVCGLCVLCVCSHGITPFPLDRLS